VVDGLDVVAVGVEDERAVVARRVVGADARPAVVGAARGERRRVEGVDLRAGVGGERDVATGRGRVAGGEDEVIEVVGAERGPVRVLAPLRLLDEPQRRERRQVEAPAGGPVADADKA
jgi:hypothetical protein